tara:strand:+ start:610 stop:1098 length:489 start_codon:yes stop_codon:yes gene_type:complete
MNRFTLFIISIILLSSCRDPYYGDLGSPSDKIEAISGSWLLENVLQIDEKAPDKKQLDLSNFYQNFIITFDKDSMTFQMDTTDLISGKNYFGNSGKWDLYNSQLSQYDNVYPDRISLENNNTVLDLFLLNPPTIFDDNLNLRYVRKCEDDQVVSYEYRFVRQ